MKKIGVFGLWHLGCVLTAAWSKLGNQVIGYDYDTKNIDNLKKGTPPLFEPFLEDTIKNGLNNNIIKYTSDQNNLNDCDFVFLAYDTPVNDDDSSDTSILTRSINDLKKVLKDEAIVIISSQSPVGFCSELRAILQTYNPTLELAYSPENLRLGEAIKCYLEPERIILGTANKETEGKCLELFKDVQGDVICMNLESSEMVKHGINSFLSMSIVFANHLADICKENGAKIQDVIKGLKSDPRIGKKSYLAPGIGFSGGTLGRDLKVLKQVNGNGYAKLFGTIHDFNAERKYSIISKLEKQFGDLKDKKIGVLGLTYKPGTSTLRRSLPMEIIDLMIEKGAKVLAFDPKADYNELTTEPKFEISHSITHTALNSDFLVLMTEWPEFKNYDWYTFKETPIFDTKIFLDGDKLIKQGIKYYSI
jgi:UDPglucose 6-dehydrogenase